MRSEIHISTRVRRSKKSSYKLHKTVKNNDISTVEIKGKDTTN